MSETLKARIVAAADAIDMRLGPISGSVADRLAELLREVAGHIPEAGVTDGFHSRATGLLSVGDATDTVIIARITAAHAMVQHVKHADRPRDLVDLASSLLEQASDRLDEQFDLVTDDWPDAEAAALRGMITNALECLPDRFEENDDVPV